MGKKHKKLKKKKTSTQLPAGANVAPSFVDNEAQSEPVSTAQTVAPAEAKEEVAEEFKYVKKDVRKILLLMLGIVILLLALYFIDQSSHYLNTVGSWFYKILNIQTQ